MEKLQGLFKIKISPDKMEATIQYNDKRPNNELNVNDPFIFEELLDFIAENHVTYGLLEDVIKNVYARPEAFREPVVIAKGKPPINGTDGFLRNEIITVSKKEIDQKQHFINLREVKQIPSVAKGQKLATIIHPTMGEDGCNVLGQKVPAKTGKPYRLRPGKNIEQINDEIFAAIDGQISFGDRTINVFPMYEVRGDLDLKTGNIDFIGNVIIRGNVPTGFKVKSKGDIQIYGLVEGAELIADGSIYITGGIAALNRGIVKAGVDIHTSYINQAHVECCRNIEVERSIFHSKCIAGGSIVTKNGTIVGGTISVGTGLEAKSIGNKMHTKTDLFIGINERIVEQEKSLQHQLIDIEDVVYKLEIAVNNLAMKLKQTGTLSPKEKQLLVKSRNTIEQYRKKQTEVREDLDELHALFTNFEDAYVIVSDVIYPNTCIHFGKYVHLANQHYRHVKVHLVENEVAFSPL
ncbi:DUF342 domain-containing protein [Calidifontibacillus oryziterrae]|uniref:DUF342 domain-containing protein n=1 Tax=Calidifontibacillus oryziterrae TaxID=1191699 RepID=UPI000307093E|nr:FapA family protein [Calidifontibacillus oryziterrae]